MRKIVWLLVATVALFLAVSVSVFAQSGRKRTPPEPPKTPDSPSKSKAEDATLNESTVDPGGETIEGDVIRVDTSLVRIPVTVMDRYGKYLPLFKQNAAHK